MTETFPPEINGVAHTVQRTVSWLAQRGHFLQLIRPRQRARGEQESECSGAGAGNVPTVLTAGMPIPMYPDLRMGLARPATLAALWREARPDLVHIATEGPLGWAALAAARRLRIPASTDFRTNFHLYSRHYGLGMARPLALAYLRWFHNRAALTMVPTRSMRKELGDAGFRNLAVIGRGVDTALFSAGRCSPALRRSWGAGPEDVVVLYVGRLAPEKNVGLVLQAFQAMQARRAGLRLVLVGDGPERARIAASHPHAVLTGWQRGEALARCYASADVFLFPSRTETFGNVVLEALASGLAVVAFAHAAAAEHVRDEVDGLLAGLGRDEQFVARAVQVTVDDALRAAVRSEAARTAASLPWHVIMSELERLLIHTAGAARDTSPRTGSLWRPR